MAETALPIAPAPSSGPPAPNLQIKTISAIDVNGNLVQIQAFVDADEFGRITPPPMSEATGQAILAALISINNTLFESTNCGAPIMGVGTAGTQG